MATSNKAKDEKPAVQSDDASTPKGANPADAPTTVEAQVNGIEVIAKVDKFYRASHCWTNVPRTVKASELSAAQIAEIKAEPMLIVREVMVSA